MTSAETTPVKLYQFALCPFCNKVKTGLQLKGIPYESVEVNPRTKVELPSLPEGAPKKVPVITIGDQAVADSTDILLRLDQDFPSTRPFLPQDGEQRTESERIEAWVDESFIPALPTVIYGTIGEARKAAKVIAKSSNFGMFEGLGVKVGGSMVMHLVAKRILKKNGRTDGHAWVRENLDQFEEWLGDKPFVCGDTLSLADVAMHGAITCVKDFPVYKEVKNRPKIATWFERVEAEKH